MDNSPLTLDLSKLEQVLFERLVRGQPREALLADLQTRMGDSEAVALLDKAVARIETLKANGGYEDAEYEVFNKPRAAKRPLWDVIAWGLMVWGALGTIVLTLEAGQLSIPGLGPLLIGSIILAVNRRA